MSVPENYEITCGYCGHINTFSTWTSLFTIGFAPDLDTRPSEHDDGRKAINSLVQKCENCGYCNESIDTVTDNLASIIDSEQYKSQLNNKQFPDGANQFLCKSMVKELFGDLEGAAWASLNAAWNCDDNGNYPQSNYCRIKAIELFQLANTLKQLKFQKSGEYPALLIDLFRRTGQFDKANTLCKNRLEQEDDNTLLKVLIYQDFLIDVQNVGIHNIYDAERYYETLHMEDESEIYEEDDETEHEYDSDGDESDWERDYFNAMTDGQLGDYEDFNGNIDDIDTWARG